MDAVRVAWRGWLAAHRFLFWAVVAWATQAIYWHREASREQLILKPRKPKDLYDAGYVLFAYDISGDGWSGYWRVPNAVPGMPAAETFKLTEGQWANAPFHEVEFSDMPHITFKVRAMALEWCRKNITQAVMAEAVEAAQEGLQPPAQPTVH